AAGIGVRGVWAKCFARLRQVPHYSEKDDDTHLPDPPQFRRVGYSLQDVQSRAPAMVRSRRGELDSRHVEIPRGLHDKKTIGASQLQELAAVAIAANEIDAASKLSAQHGLGSKIIGITVQAAAGKIMLGVVGGGIEP